MTFPIRTQPTRSLLAASLLVALPIGLFGAEDPAVPGASVPGASVPRSTVADDPADLLLKAEAEAAKGRYKDAVRTYEKLAKDHAGTPEGAIGRRRSRPSAYLGFSDVVRHGPSNNRVDIVLMGEGYQLGEQDQFAKLADDIPPVFARQKTLREYYPYFNFLRAALVSADNGVDGFGREYDTALGGKTLSTIAGHVGIERSEVMAMLDEMPEHDNQVIVFVKLGVLGTGGGGIATIGGRNVRTVVHEFGHSFGGLSDEYSTKTHDRGSVSDGINVSSREDPETAPWAHWIEAKVRGIGMYEGASGQPKGAWKPTSGNCSMANGETFCPICQEQMVLTIYRHVDPIDSVDPPANPHVKDDALVLDDRLTFEAQVMTPEKHNLQVSWWIYPEGQGPALVEEPSRGDGGTRAERRGGRNLDRRARGPLVPIEDKPAEFSKGRRKGDHSFTLKRSQLEPGLYRIICRAQDTAEVRGDKYPWVLRDEQGLLESERSWWVRVPE